MRWTELREVGLGLIYSVNAAQQNENRPVIKSAPERSQRASRPRPQARPATMPPIEHSPIEMSVNSPLAKFIYFPLEAVRSFSVGSRINDSLENRLENIF